MLLLILILCSFLINNKKISYLESSLEKKEKAFKQFIDETSQSLNKLSSDYQSAVSSLKAYEQSVKFLKDNQQEFTDNFKGIKNRLDSCESNIRALAHKVSESKKNQVNSQSENLNKAVSMLENGLEIKEAADKEWFEDTYMTDGNKKRRKFSKRKKSGFRSCKY